MLPIHRAGKQQNSQAGQRADHEAIGFEVESLHDNLHRKGGNDGHDGHPHLIGRGVLLVLLSRDGQVFIVARFAVANEDGDE